MDSCGEIVDRADELLLVGDTGVFTGWCLGIMSFAGGDITECIFIFKGCEKGFVVGEVSDACVMGWCKDKELIGWVLL